MDCDLAGRITDSTLDEPFLEEMVRIGHFRVPDRMGAAASSTRAASSPTASVASRLAAAARYAVM
jgi:hypothetical protein